jgi:hypothetical protein
MGLSLGGQVDAARPWLGGRGSADGLSAAHARATSTEARLAVDGIIAQLARSVGAEKSHELVTRTAAELGIAANELSEREATLLLDALSRTPGVVGASSRHLRARLLAVNPEPPVPARCASVRAATNGLRRSRRPAPVAKRPKAVLAGLLAHSLGLEKSLEVVAASARKLLIDDAAFNRAEALQVLEDLSASPGIVGVTAKFAKARCILRFPE